jgi:hypothetical protein
MRRSTWPLEQNQLCVYGAPPPRPAGGGADEKEGGPTTANRPPLTEQGAAELDRQTLQRVLALPGDLWLDVHGDHTDR